MDIFLTDDIFQENSNIKMNTPKKLYKYREWDNLYHREILENNMIYLASPSSFEDPLDCNPPIRYPKGQELFSFF